MTPGTYIRHCRQETGLTCEDVALQLESEPPVSCRSRTELLEAIEADLVPVSLSTALALAGVRIGIDLPRLAELVDARVMELVSRSGVSLQIFGSPRLRSAAVAPLLLNLGGEAAA